MKKIIKLGMVALTALTMAYESARYKDYNLLMVLCILTGIVVVVCNMIAQTINERIDPRIRQ